MELLERAPFLEALAGSMAEAASGHGRLVFLGGEAGVGKSVLVQALCDAVATDARVLIGACDSFSTPRPLGPLSDMAPALGGELLRSLGRPGERARSAAFGAFLAELAEHDKPTLAVFEDVHWADEATLDLLRYLGRRVASTRALVVATYRDDEVGAKHPLRAVMGDLATSPAVLRLSLTRLSVNAVRILAKGSDLNPMELYRTTGGNPFFVTEVLASGAAGVPVNVSDAVLARASRLPEVARGALEAACIVGLRVEPWLASALAGTGPDALEACVSSGMLQAEGSTLTFRHELAREALVGSLSPVRRTALHRGALDALRTSGAPELSRLAYHAEGADDHPAVMEFAPAAGLQASSAGAHREAVAQYARALRFADGLPALTRADLLERYAGECSQIDRLDRCIAARQEAIELRGAAGDRLGRSMTLCHLSRTLIMAGRDVEAEEANRTAMAELESMPPGPEFAFAMANGAYLRMLSRDTAQAVRDGKRAIELARRFDSLPTAVQAHNVVGSALILMDRPAPGRRHLEQSLQLAHEIGSDTGVAGAYGNLGSGFGEMYRFADAERYLTEGIRYCADRDMDSSRSYMTAWLSLTRFQQGEWQEATDMAARILDQADTAAISRTMALLALGRIRARRGDPEVWPVLDEALELALRTGTMQRLGPVHAARAEAAYLAGDLATTGLEARAAFDLAVAHMHPWFLGELGYWRWRVGDLERAPPGAARAFALQIAGDAPAAAAEWNRLGCPYESARALAESDDEEGLRHAHATFERLGSPVGMEAIARRLKALGLKGLSRGPRPSTLRNVAGLTQREVEVLRLVAAGHTNVDIAAMLVRSPRTIDHHVSAILAKLGARNRTGAVREARTLGILADGETGWPPDPT